MGHNMVFILRHNKINRDFDCHTDAAVQCGVHRLMEHIPGFTRSHWMPPMGNYLHIALPQRPPWLTILVEIKKQKL